MRFARVGQSNVRPLDASSFGRGLTSPALLLLLLPRAATTTAVLCGCTDRTAACFLYFLPHAYLFYLLHTALCWPARSFVAIGRTNKPPVLVSFLLRRLYRGLSYSRHVH